ncbi:MAG: hypothetical protein H6719_14485 [Sandaracinaceae bacterium]|nr:hypothetical protein [Sandaracinaceae bacterium]
MRSRSLERWRTDRRTQLDQIAHAHARVGGTGPGRRYATQQVNHAYVMLLASQFQGFCRDLHSEAADVIARAVQPIALQPLVKQRLTAGRQLDSGNAQPGSIGSDFGRFFATKFWDEVDALNARHAQRRADLGSMNDWRNAIAHQDFSAVGTSALRLGQVRNWRANCNVLATAFDDVLSRRLRALVGSRPW